MGCGPHIFSKLVSVGGPCLPCRWDVLLGRLRFSTKWFAWACAVLGIVPLACANGPTVFMFPVAALTAPPGTQWGGGGWRFSRLNLPVTPGFSAGLLGSAGPVRTPDCGTPCQARSLFTR